MKRHIGPVSYMTSAANFAGLSKAPEKKTCALEMQLW